MCGYIVEELFDPLDLIVWGKDYRAVFCEVKLPTANASKWTRVQLQFIARTKAPVMVVTSGEDAVVKLRNQTILTDEQKWKVQDLLSRDDRKFFTEKDLRDVL